MFDFFGDPGFLAAFALMMAVACGCGLGWAPGRPHLLRLFRLGFGTAFLIGVVLMNTKWGWTAAAVCVLAGVFICYLVGMPLGYLLFVAPPAVSDKPAQPGAATDLARGRLFGVRSSLTRAGQVSGVAWPLDHGC